ncbi:lipase chaperone [Thalassomonas viridans]|uniref:Lipase chaperone n=1 Tax=Thalassomonas viridans TaxID=137584 RepID=A0AAE9Z1F9_9GAMM|nr:lipase secretion chaperone [Thalassomonas viridans]WDE04264.1 lipase chaperone [Thalassomonas viridans]
MKKAFAALAAISLLLGLSLLKPQQPEDSSAPAVNKAVQKPAPLAKTGKNSLDKNNTGQDRLTVRPAAIEAGLNAELELALSLRYRFDDIIHRHLGSGEDLGSLLQALAASLKLTPAAGEDLQALFSRYRQYLSAMSRLKEKAPQVDTVIDLSESRLFLQQVYQLQEDYFSEAEIRAFFAHEKTYNRQTLERVAIRQDTSLDKAQRQMLIEHQLSQLEPEALAPLQPTLTARKITRLITGEQSQDLTLAPQVSEKIRATREKNRLWQQKVRDYQQKIAAIEHLDSDSYNTELERYRLQHFSSNELKRLRVFLKHPELLSRQTP